MSVRVEHLWKTFRIPHEKRTTIFENLAELVRPNRYETFFALKDINFEVNDGEFIGIRGGKRSVPLFDFPTSCCR